MSGEDCPVTVADLERLVEVLQEANAKLLSAVVGVSHQAAAGSIVNALLVRELRRAGVINPIALRAEAIRRAEPLGPAVIALVEDVLGGEAPSLPDVPPIPPFTVISGGLSDRE